MANLKATLRAVDALATKVHLQEVRFDGVRADIERLLERCAMSEPRASQNVALARTHRNSAYDKLQRAFDLIVQASDALQEVGYILDDATESLGQADQA